MESFLSLKMLKEARKRARLVGENLAGGSLREKKHKHDDPTDCYWLKPLQIRMVKLVDDGEGW